MAAITQERMLELIAIYDALKVKVEAVDRKYSLDYHEPLIDMPESLNLTKLEFIPKTEQELTELANRQVEATYISKQRQLDTSKNNSMQSINKKYADLAEELRVKSQTLLNNYNAACDKLKIKLINNGLMYSTVNSKANAQARDDYDKSVRELNAQYDVKREQIDDEKKYIETSYTQNCLSLADEQKAAALKVYDSLVESQYKEEQSVDKYNTGLDEKEAKYQAARAKAIEYAWEAEYDRAFNAAKLYQQMGANGFQEMKLTEKLNLCKQAFMPLKRNEAQTLLTVDSFLKTHLLDYYSAFVDWINYALIA